MLTEAETERGGVESEGGKSVAMKWTKRVEGRVGCLAGEKGKGFP